MCHFITATALVKLVTKRLVTSQPLPPPPPRKPGKDCAGSAPLLLQTGFCHMGALSAIGRTWAHSYVGPGQHSSRHPPKVFVGVKQLVRCQEEKGCQWFCTIYYLHRRGGTEKPSQGQPVCRSSGHPLSRQGGTPHSRNMKDSHRREKILMD